MRVRMSSVARAAAQVGVRRVAPRPMLDPPDRREPAAPAAQLVERQAERDRVQPGTDVDAIEPGPRPIRLEIGVLGDVLGVVRIAQHEHQSANEVRVVRPDRGLERIVVVPRRGGAVDLRRRPNIGRGHGIGCPKQSPTPVASRRWSTTMITFPPGNRDPGMTNPCGGGVETWTVELVPLPPSADGGGPGLDLPIDLGVAVGGQEGGGVGRGHALHRWRRRAAGRGSRSPGSPRPSG